MVFGEDIMEKLTTMKEKLIWLNGYFEHSENVARRSAELYFRATQIPRNATWNDYKILDMVEVGDKQRILYDELSQFYRITIINDINSLSKRINEEISLLKAEIIVLEDKLKVCLEDLDKKKSKHLEAWLYQKIDPWITEMELKCSLRAYLIEKEKVRKEFNVKIKKSEEAWNEIEATYKEIINNYIKIQKNHYKNLHQSLDMKKDGHFSANIEQETFYEIKDNVSADESEKEKERIEEKFNNYFDKIMEDIDSKVYENKRMNISKNIRVSKYAICRFKKGFTTEWRPTFFVYTENKFLHGFDLENILLYMDDLKISYKKMLSLIFSDSNRNSFFFIDNIKEEIVKYNDEIDLKNMNETIFENLDYRDAQARGFPINLEDSRYKIEKNKYEIIISNKKNNSLANFFMSNDIKVRTYTLKDLYELFFSLKGNFSVGINKSEEINEENVGEIQNEEIIERVIEKKEERILWIAEDEINPWSQE